MNRREVIAGFALPFLAGGTWAQQAVALRQIGAIVGTGDSAAYAQALRQGLESLGWIEGQNMKIETRFAPGDLERIKSEAARLMAQSPEVIVSGGTLVTAALQQLTRTIPIVFVHIGDPLALVQSLARPEGNLTGFAAYDATSVGGKWLELLKEIAPHITNVLVLAGQTPTWRMHVPAIEAAAPSFGVDATVSHVDTAAAIDPAIETFAARPNAGMIVLADTLFDHQREQIVSLAAKHRIPAIYTSAGGVVGVGGLLHYNSDWVDLYRRAASYVDRLLKGAKIADLPIQQANKFRLALNLRTAKELGLIVPATLLARADEVIE